MLQMCSTKYLKYRDGWVLPVYFKSLGLSFASKMGPDTGFLSWQSPRPLSVTHTETLITFLGLCVHKPELAIWVLDQVPGYFNEVPCLGVHNGRGCGDILPLCDLGPHPEAAPSSGYERRARYRPRGSDHTTLRYGGVGHDSAQSGPWTEFPSATGPDRTGP